MMILALEFSSAQRSVALARDGQPLAEASETTGGRGTDALGLVARVLAETGVARTAVEVIALGLGPGSYTGIRAAIAVAQGWQLANGAKLIGVGSVESLAAQAQAEKLFGRVHLAVDAQRGEFYVALWEITAHGCTEISPLKIVPATAIAALQATGEIYAGPEMARALFPSASRTAALAAQRREFVAGEKLEPVYLREASFAKAPVGRVL